MASAVITGLGFITCIGNDRAAVLSSLVELKHGFEKVTWLGNPRVPAKVLGTVKGFEVASPEWRDWRWPERYVFGSEILRSWLHTASLPFVRASRRLRMRVSRRETWQIRTRGFLPRPPGPPSCCIIF